MKKFKCARMALGLALFPFLTIAQSFQSDINDAISKLTTLVILFCAGAGVYSGIEFAKGNPGAQSRLVMCVIGSVIAAIGSQLVRFFVGAH